MKKQGVRITAVVLLALLSLTSIARAELKHRWSMTDGTDSVGSADLTLAGSNPARFSGGTYDSAAGLVGGEDERYLDAQGASLTEVAATITGTGTLSFEFWFNQSGEVEWAKLMMLGNSQTDYIAVTAQDGGGVLASQYEAFDAVEQINGAELSTNADYYVLLVIDDVSDTMSMYYGAVNQILASVSVALTPAYHVLADLKVTAFSLGGNDSAEFWPNGSFDGTIDEVRIWDNALTASEAVVNFAAGPNVIP